MDIQEIPCEDVTRFNVLGIIWESKKFWGALFQVFREPRILSFGHLWDILGSLITNFPIRASRRLERMAKVCIKVCTCIWLFESFAMSDKTCMCILHITHLLKRKILQYLRRSRIDCFEHGLNKQYLISWFLLKMLS